MGKLVNLLRWKKMLILLNENGKPVLDEKKKPVSVWIRIIGDESQQEAYKMARIKSAEKRAALRDINNTEYKDLVMPIGESDRDTCTQLIKLSRGNDFTSEALANVERPDLPKMEEISIDADFPKLEEQEKFDVAVEDIEKEYQKAIEAYIEAKNVELDAELASVSLEDIRVQAMYETSNAIALNTFLVEVQTEKAWRGTYMDEDCTIPAYDSAIEFKEQHPFIKKQILENYIDLEDSAGDIKN